MMMPLVREETRILMAQFRRNIITSRGNNAMAIPSPQQHRQSDSVPSVNPAILSRILRDPQAKDQVGVVRAAQFDGRSLETLDSKLAEGKAAVSSPNFCMETSVPPSALTKILHADLASSEVAATQQVTISFSDGCEFGFNGAWLIDSTPDQTGLDSYRKSPEGVGYLLRPGCFIKEVRPRAGGSMVDVHWGTRKTAIPSVWLRAWASSVAEPLNGFAEHATARESIVAGPNGSSAERGPFAVAERLQKPWYPADMQNPPRFSYEELLNDQQKHIEFIETMSEPGFAFVDGVPNPSEEGKSSIEGVAKQLVGRCIPHATRRQDFWHMTTRLGGGFSGKDYEFKDALAMHTDHSSYAGTPGFVSWMHQVEGMATTRIADGLAIVEEFRTTRPQQYEMLSSIPVAHGVRHRLYTPDGRSRNVNDPEMAYNEFDLTHHAPVINLWRDGSLAKLVHSETKRTIFSGVPPTKMAHFLEAYDEFCQLADAPEFVLTMPWPESSTLVFNNHRLVHGRADILSAVRTLHGCYNTRAQIGHKYRLLRMRAAASKLGLDDKWLTHLNETALLNMEAEADGQNTAKTVPVAAQDS